MDEQRQGQEALLTKVLGALQYARTEIKEMEKLANLNDKQLAVLEKELESTKKDTEQALRRVNKLEDAFNLEVRQISTDRGGTAVKWAILGAIASALLVYFIRNYFPGV